ncbi:MAG: phosphate ABC transporter permease subunit PstC [Chloroflexota bacterium]|nr:phosphate ABC transporter permease subunit PstC [Chloroflexota bacterium]
MATTSPVGQKKPITVTGANLGDRIFASLTAIFAAVIILIVVVFGVVFTIGSWNAIWHNGLEFFTSFNWPDNGFDNPKFGALNYIFGTLVSSGIALLIGGFASIGAAVFLSEYAPGWLRTPLSFMVELLAAVPSIVYGFWGVQFLSGIMGGPEGVEQSLNNTFGWLPMFNNLVTTTTGRELKVAFNGRDILVASLVLSVMIIPTITSISRDVIRTVPDSQREGMLAMGATKWQSIRRAVLPFGQRGIIGAIVLGLGRALGETIAVAFLIGGASTLVGPQNTLLNRGETIASKFANNYNEISPADTNGFSSFLELGLVLFVIALLINILAQWLVTRSTAKSNKQTQQKKTLLTTVWKWLLLLLFPILVLMVSPFLSLAISLIIIVVWGFFKALRAYQVSMEEQNKHLPRPLELIANPDKSYNYRKFMNLFMQVLFVIALLVAIVPLAAILILVTTKGLPVLFQTDFLINDTSGRPLFGGAPTSNTGIAQAILGTGVLVALGSLIGIPLGILAGIYLSEYGDNKFGQLVRFTADVLQGIPSIIMGLFILTVVINTSLFVPGQKYNGWAGALALAIMMVPIITRTTEEILRLVPVSLREAGLALGVPKWKTTLTVVIPSAISGVITGVILGVARIAGETAPVLLTARGNDSFNGLNDQTPALTLIMYTYGRRPDTLSVDRSWGAAFTLMVIVLLLSVGVRYVTRSRIKASL